MLKLELLSPAKDSTTAIAAIDCGADAVYIGASKFSARQAAANTLDDLSKTIEYAHQYRDKVYAAINTILTDDELTQAQALIQQLYEIGIDGIIIQDVGLLNTDLPPVPIIASTQMNIDTIEKAQFFASLGLKRIILPRELSLDEIAAIHKSCPVELEAFVHGALCVSRSGKCYMSYALGNRSGNRGQCAQPCRKPYRLEDSKGNIIEDQSYLLSIMDMNRSEYIEQMIDAGITSFKIEGRLKSIHYVANITAYYRNIIDQIIRKKNQSLNKTEKLTKASSGTIELNFTPDPRRSFNRGFTAYNISGKQEKIGTPKTPKSIGQYIGTVQRLNVNCFELDSEIQLNNADGICFFDRSGALTGTVINLVESNEIIPADMTGLYLGCRIYRNNDHQFNQLLDKQPAKRKIHIEMKLTETEDGLRLEATDENDITAAAEITCTKEPARNTKTAEYNLQTNSTKLGNTIFHCDNLAISFEQMYFIPTAKINELRRLLVKNLLSERLSQLPSSTAAIVNNNLPYPQKYLDYTANILNKKAEEFYQSHGVQSIDPAAETGIDLTDKTVMTTRYCIRKQLDICRPKNPEPLYLIDENNNRFKVTFNCPTCGMKIVKA